MQAHRAGGFNLIELMIVVAVIAILATLAAPNFSEALQNSRTRSVAESMQNGLRFAQGEAARMNRITTFTPSGGTGWVVTYIKTSADPAATSTTLQQAVDSNLGSVAISPPTQAVSFNSLGRTGTAGTFSTATGSTGFTQAAGDVTYQITNASGPRKLKILISPGGKVRMCDADKAYDVNSTPDGCP